MLLGILQVLLGTGWSLSWNFLFRFLLDLQVIYGAIREEESRKGTELICHVDWRKFLFLSWFLGLRYIGLMLGVASEYFLLSSYLRGYLLLPPLMLNDPLMFLAALVVSLYRLHHAHAHAHYLALVIPLPDHVVEEGCLDPQVEHGVLEMRVDADLLLENAPDVLQGAHVVFDKLLHALALDPERNQVQSLVRIS
jgi:hypothetical protein